MSNKSTKKSKVIVDDTKIQKSLKTMNIILIVIGVFLVLFIACMIWIYIATGGIPDTLVSCVFVACTGELGIMGWIKSTKDKYIKRAEKLENIALGLKPQIAKLDDFIENTGDEEDE